MRTDRRVAIVYPFINLDSVPCLGSAAILLAGRGYLVDIYTFLDPDCVAPSFDDGRITVLPSLVPGRNRRPWHRRATGARWLLTHLARHRRAPYVCVIGVDPEGLLLARDAMTRWTGVPLAYYSLELLLSHELTREEDLRRKARERALSREAPFVVIQDEERAGLLARDNGLPPDRLILVPNAPLGSADRRRSRLLRERFAIPPQTRIVLHTGSLDEWTCARALVGSTREWPEGWVLVCHTRYRGTALDGGYMGELARLAAPGRVVFSTDPLPRKDYPELVRSADVGAAFYAPQEGKPSLGDNIRHLGLSSGKVAQYLQAGLPILVNDISSLRHLVERHGCGAVVESPGSTRAALERLFADHDAYSRRAAACFDRELDAAAAFGGVVEALERLERGGRDLPAAKEPPCA